MYTQYRHTQWVSQGSKSCVEEIFKSLLLLQCITISSNNRTVRNRKGCTENTCPAYVADGFKTHKNAPVARKEKPTISSDDVRFSNRML